MISVIKLLDRYEILYPDNEKIPLLRRSVFEKDFGSLIIEKALIEGTFK